MDFEKLVYGLIKEKFKPVKKYSTFAGQVTRLEGKKIKLTVAQVSEVMKCINEKTNGEFYKFLKRGK